MSSRRWCGRVGRRGVPTADGRPRSRRSRSSSTRPSPPVTMHVPLRSSAWCGLTTRSPSRSMSRSPSRRLVARIVSTPMSAIVSIDVRATANGNTVGLPPQKRSASSAYAEVVDVELERVGVGEPPDVGRPAPVDHVRVDPQPSGARAAAQPLDARSDDEVGVPVVDVDRNDADRLGDVDDRHDASGARDVGDVGRRNEFAGVGVDVGDEHDVDSVVEVARPHVEIEGVLVAFDVSDVVARVFAHESERRKGLLGQQDRRSVEPNVDRSAPRIFVSALLTLLCGQIDAALRLRSGGPERARKPSMVSSQCGHARAGSVSQTPR